jgi:copper(I)-binding protein
MTHRILFLAPLALLAACHPRTSEPKVTEAWVRLPAVAGQPAAAYFTIHGGRAPANLVHQSMAGMQGMTIMAPLDHVDVPTGGTITFKPGGYHAMLIGLDPVVKPGTAVPLRFGFADGTTAEAEAKSVGAGGDAPY